MERTKRRFRTKQERREIVEETLKPGASVAVIARAHGVNANQVFGWRKLYREGRLDTCPPSTALIAVRLAEAVEPMWRGGRESKLARSGIIDIDLGHARVRIEGAADPDCVRAAVEGLARR